MKTRSLAAIAAVAALAATADPSVSVDSVVQDPETHVVTVSYTLSGESAAVTAEMLVNGSAVGSSHVAGEINKKVGTGPRTFTWSPERDVADVSGTDSLSVELKVWTGSNPPPYMSVELLPPYAIGYYSSTNALDKGGLSDEFKTTRLLMRLVPAKNVTWWMGAPSGEAGQTSANAEFRHKVKLTSNYYLGVFPVTQKQYSVAYTNAAPFNYKNNATYPSRMLFPAEGIKYVDLRGPTETYNWPATGRGEVASGSFLGMLRTNTGVDFDLPTDAEWEYACRAGTAEALSSGKSYTEANLSELGWFKTTADPPSSPRPVGLKMPNPWGFYDMHGNVYEWCLDWYKEKLQPASEPEENPVGPLQSASTGNRVLRGGSWTATGDRARSAYRYNYNAPEKGSLQTGFRLWAPATVK